MGDDAILRLLHQISLHKEIINFGSARDARDSAWVERAENFLGFPLSKSYKWFLGNYQGGEVGSEEIFSIYGVDFESAVGGDVVYQYINDKKNGFSIENGLVVSRTDFGEVFFFDYSRFREEEAPLCLRLPSGAVVDYAPNFYEFLIKRIRVHC